MHIIENSFQIQQSKEKLLNAEIIAVDIETYDHKNIESFGKIRLVQVATEYDIFVFDLFQIELPQFFIDILENPQIIKIMHHAIFDISHLIKYYNCKIENSFCTAISSRILSSGLSIRNSLKATAKRFLDIDIDKTEQTSDWGGELTSSQIEYAAEDAKILIPLYKKLNSILKEKKLLHIGRMEFKIQEISAELKAKGVEIDKEKLINAKKEILCNIPESINIDEIIASNKKSGIKTIDNAILKLKKIEIFEKNFFPLIKIKWNKGFVLYQKNFNNELLDYMSGSIKTISFENLWLPAVSVCAGDYKSRELVGKTKFPKSDEGVLLQAFSIKDYRVIDAIDKGKAFKTNYPGISKWQDDITGMVVRKSPIRLKTGRIIHTRELGVDTIEIFRLMLKSLISDFAKTFIVLLHNANGQLIQVDSNNFNMKISFNYPENPLPFIEKAAKFVFGTTLPSHFYTSD